MHRLILVLLAVLSLASCKTLKKNTGTKTVRPLTAEQLLEKLYDSRDTPEWLYTAGQIRYQDPVTNVNLSFASILRKDSVLVLVVKKFGIVVSKVKITPDSVIVLNTLERTWHGTDLQALSTKYGVPARFGAIQDLFIGNPVWLTRQNATASIENNLYKYTAHDARWRNTFYLSPSIEKISKQILQDKQYATKVTAYLDDYKKTNDDALFSFLRIFELTSPQTGKVNLKIIIKKAVRNVPRKIHFSIPAHYTEVD